MSSPPILIIQAGTPTADIITSHGDLPEWFCRALSKPIKSMQVVRVFEGDLLPAPDPNRIAIITGSWSMVTDKHQWSELTAQWIREAMAIEMPIFGVCYGHQLMAHALGGRVDYHADGREIGCQTIQVLPAAQGDPLLGAFPQKFPAHLTHEQSVIELPPGATALASSDHDPHQIIRYSPTAISTQFHPEFTKEISKAIILFRAEALEREGFSIDQLLQDLMEATEAGDLMRNFVESAL